MKKDTKFKKALEVLAGLGISQDTITEVEINKSAEAEAVLAYVVEGTTSSEHNRKCTSCGKSSTVVVHHKFVERNCLQCKTRFKTDYRFNAYCSNSCRAKALRDIGIEWDPTKPEDERWKPWGPKVPLAVPGVVLELLENTLPELSETPTIPSSHTPSVQTLLESLGIHDVL